MERFRSLRMTIREGGWALIWEICYARADGLSFGRYVTCFGTSGVIYDTSRPLEKGRAEGAGWIHAAV